MNNESHSWSKEDSIRSIQDIINVGRTAVAGFISWASEVPGRVDNHYSNQLNGDSDDL